MSSFRKILYLQYANPAAFPPVVHSARILADHGWKVHLLGAHSEGTENLELSPHRNISCEVLPRIPPGWRQKIAYLRFTICAIRLVVRWRPDWIYVSDWFTTPIGLLLIRILHCKIIYHEHDALIPQKNSSWPIRFIAWNRRLLARAAELNVLPQRERMRLFVEETGTRRPVHCVWNCPSRYEILEKTRIRQQEEPLAVYYHGVINLRRVPLALIKGAAMCNFAVRIRVVGYETSGSRGSINELRKAAAAISSNVVVEFPGPASRHHLQELMEGMHIGWISFIQDPTSVNHRHMAGASNKAFDYLAASLPIIVCDTPDWKSLYVEPGYGRACNAADPESIAATLAWFYENRQAAAQMGQKACARIGSDWNYEVQFNPVLEALNEKQSASFADPISSR